jgi:hypothetical protein
MPSAIERRGSRIARILMGLGVTVGVTAASLAALEIQLNLPDWLVRVAMIKLAFIGSFGLLAAGALIGRHAKSRAVSAERSSPQLPEGPPPDTAPDSTRARSRVERNERGDVT